MIYSVTDDCILRSLVSWGVTVYSYVDIEQYNEIGGRGFCSNEEVEIAVRASDKTMYRGKKKARKYSV